MPLEAELLALMRDQVILEPRASQDVRGEFAYGAPVPVDCYISYRTMKAINREGSEVTSQVQVILGDPTLAVTADWRLTLPGGSQPTIIEVLAAPDDQGPYYLEVRA